MQVKDFMTKDVVSCNVDHMVEETAKIMSDKNFSVIPVVNAEGKLVGVVTESDFIGKEIDVPHALASIKQLFGQNYYFLNVEEVYANAKKKKLADVMSTNIKSVTPETSLSSAVNLMMAKHLKRLPVIDRDKLVGIITRKDIVTAFSKL